MIGILHLSENRFVFIKKKLPLIVVSEVYVITYPQISVIRFFEAHKDLQQSGFPDSVVSYDADPLSFTDQKPCVVEQFSAAVTL